MTARINARLESDLVDKLDYLRRRTGKSTTEIIRASLEQYYTVVHSEAEPAVLLEAFVGCAEGAVDLASTYKVELTRSLGRKSLGRKKVAP